MVKFIFLFLLLFGYNNIYCQNYVLNPSFEDFDTIPPHEDYAKFWYRYQSVDLFSTIASPFVWPSPCTVFGCQSSRTGDSHIGLYLNSPTNSYREYIQTQFALSLDSGKNYCVSFYVSRSDTMEYAAKNWGILFTDTLIEPPSTSDYLINAMAQVTVPYFVTDDVNWTLIQQIYTPASANQYLTIGNFLPDSLFPQLFIQSSCGGCKQSYYFIDDVSVSLIRNPVLSNDTTIYAGESILIGDTAQDVAEYSWYPTTGLNNPSSWQTLATPLTTTTYTLTKITACDTTEASIKIEVLAKENNFTILPNPNNGNFQINYNLVDDASFIIYDALGRKVYKTKLVAGSNILFTPNVNLASALYFLTLENENGERLFYSKMVVEE